MTAVIAELERRLDTIWREAALDVVTYGGEFATPAEVYPHRAPIGTRAEASQRFADMDDATLGAWLDECDNEYKYEILDYAEGRMDGLGEALKLIRGGP